MSKQNKITGSGMLFLLQFMLVIFIINSAPALATPDLVGPANNAYTNNNLVTFEYHVNIDNITECKLIVDSEIKETNTNITNSDFNQFTANLTIGSHNWSIICDSTNSSESSEQRTITIDILEPTIVLFFPINNTQINTSNTGISFVALDNIAEDISCNIIMNNTVNKSMIVKNSEPATANLAPLSDGKYEWKITCYDYANNSETSEARVFRINTTSPVPIFNINIQQSEYALGEYGLMTINAPNGTSVRIEVCPDKPGFVECKVPVNAQNVMNYPFQEYLPFANYEGEYILEAFFNYIGITQTQALSYEIKNNINIDIDTDDSQRKNVPVLLEADATGGVGKLNYTWHLSNGSLINNRKANITYSSSGEYTELVVVKDEYNNTRNKSITISAEDTVHVIIIVKDASNNAAVQAATVEIKGEKKDTGSNGEVNYYLRVGEKEIFVLAENYSLYHDEINITKDQTFTILLQPEQSQQPIVSLLGPENNSLIQGTTTDLVFKAEYNSSLNCSVYINEKNDGFFMYLGSVSVNDNAEKPFGITELENKTYWWKVECVNPSNSNGNNGLSQTWMFRVGAGLDLTTGNSQGSGAFKAYNNWVKEFEQILNTFNNLPKDEKEASDALGITNRVEESITALKSTIRDLDALKFRNDLTDEEKQEEGQKLVQLAEEAYQKTPVSIELLNSEAFVGYIKQEELSALLKEYVEIKNITEKINEEKILKYLNELQQEVVISTKIRSIRVTYRNGAQSDASVVLREIKAYNLTDGAFILEVIPKDVAETADAILSSQKYEVIKKDPIIKFDLKGDTTITYYFEANHDSEALKNIKTAVFVEPNLIEEKNEVTGFSIKSLKLPKIKGIIFIPVIVALLGGLVFIGIRYDGLDAAKYMFYRAYGQKSLHYIKVILNEINDTLDSGDVEKALSLYDEAKGAYNELSALAKNDVYDKVSESANRVKEYCEAIQSQNNISEIKAMMDNIHALLSQGQIGPALEVYKRIEAAYNQLGDESKEMLHPTLVALGNKVQIMIDNTRNLI
jgi:hypothetical protein